MSNEKEINEIEHSTKTHASYALGSLFDDFIITALGIMVFKFYETEVFLPILFITLAISIYGFWNMVNDPIAGHISDKFNFKFMKHRGKRFTWFLFASIPCSIMFVFIFLPPMGNYIIIFIWLLLALCLFDTLFSFMMINWQKIFPDKFRSQKERTKVGGIQILYSLVGLTLGMILPVLFITTGDPGTNIPSYVIVGMIVSIICIVTALLILPGMREDREMIERTFQVDITKQDQGAFIDKMKFAFKQKNFIAYLMAYLAQTTVMVLMLASVPYWTQYVVNVDQYTVLIALFAFLLASVVSSPFWIKIARKYGNRIGYMCGTGGTATFLLITMFIWEFPFFILGFICIGISMGATWSLIYVCFSDVIDDIVLKTGKREEGVYYGFRTFIGRLSIVIQAITFGIIHPLTGFDPKSSTQSIQAQWGIMFAMFAIPAFFYLMGFLAMWRVYDLKPDKVQTIKNKLIQLNL
jgi:GPH family glycoside/pentoside/hexuronide:cation symporter